MNLPLVKNNAFFSSIDKNYLNNLKFNINFNKREKSQLKSNKILKKIIITSKENKKIKKINYKIELEAFKLKMNSQNEKNDKKFIVSIFNFLKKSFNNSKVINYLLNILEDNVFFNPKFNKQLNTLVDKLVYKNKIIDKITYIDLFEIINKELNEIEIYKDKLNIEYKIKYDDIFKNLQAVKSKNMDLNYSIYELKTNVIEKEEKINKLESSLNLNRPTLTKLEDYDQYKDLYLENALINSNYLKEKAKGLNNKLLVQRFDKIYDIILDYFYKFEKKNKNLWLKLNNINKNLLNFENMINLKYIKFQKDLKKFRAVHQQNEFFRILNKKFLKKSNNNSTLPINELNKPIVLDFSDIMEEEDSNEIKNTQLSITEVMTCINEYLWKIGRFKLMLESYHNEILDKKN